MVDSTSSRKGIVVAIALLVGLLHFVTGPTYRGPFPVFVNSYLIDILLPFTMFLVLGVANIPILNTSIVRTVFVFGIGVLTETLQYFHVPIFGRTFDPLDLLMYGIGIGLAVVFEKQILKREMPSSSKKNE